MCRLLSPDSNSAHPAPAVVPASHVHLLPPHNLNDRCQNRRLCTHRPVTLLLQSLSAMHAWLSKQLKTMPSSCPGSLARAIAAAQRQQSPVCHTQVEESCC